MEKGRKYSKKPVQEFIDTVKKLKSIGVDIRDIKQRDTIEILAKRYGITIKQLEELNLNPKNKIGITKSTIACTYRGIGKHKPPTDEELKEINDLGIVLEKKSRVQNFIDNIKKLKSAKADLPEIRADDTIETLAKRAGITER